MPSSFNIHGPSKSRTSRRDLLKAAAAVAGVATAGSVLSSCTKKGGSSGGEITLRLADAPFRTMPTSKEQKNDITARAYAHALQAWLDKNPGVKLKKASIDIWNQEAIVTAAAGGTAPAIYDANTLGNFEQPGILSAFKQGLCADVTPLLERHRLADKLASYVKPVWGATWQVDGKYFGAPMGFGISDGMFYRRDLLAAAGLPEPTPDWTWRDVRKIAKGLTKGKRKGFASPQWGLYVALDSDGFGLLTTIPAPKTRWRWTWDYTAGAAKQWIPGVENWRGMMFTDKSLLSDITYGTWNEVTAAFARGDAGMQAGNVNLYLTPAGQDNSFLDLAEKEGKPLDEVVGWMTYPLGDHGQYPARRSFLGVNGFSPDLGDEELDKAFGLHVHMTGPGLLMQAAEVYRETKDLKKVYSGESLMPLRADVAEKLPGSPEEAWGESFIAQLKRAAERPNMPDPSAYLPPEESTGPPKKPVDDAMSKWMYEPGRPDVMKGLKGLQDVRNRQAKSFASSASEAEFVKGARQYFRDQDAFWKKDAPEFHEQVFRGWYEDRVLPALGD